METIIWDKPEQLQPYYDFIVETKQLLNKIFAYLKPKYTRNGFKLRVNPLQNKTNKGIYLTCEDGQIKDLWTPFGKIKLLISKDKDEAKQISDLFLKELQCIEIQCMAHKGVITNWPADKAFAFPLLNDFYKLIWNTDQEFEDNKLYTQIKCNLTLEDYDRIFNIVSKGKNTF